jgi:gliding motility-associated lipoprotein GldB
MIYKGSLFLVICTFLQSCANDDCEVEESISGIPVNIEISRLEDTMFSLQSSEEVRDFLNENSAMKIHFLASDQYPDDSILINNLFRRIKDPHIDTLLREVRQEFADFSDLKLELEAAYRYLKSFYPEILIPKVQTMVTGFGSSELYVSDSLIIIGLDYYIGPYATYRPIEIPNYILKRYQKEYIVPAIILLLANKFVKDDYSDRTMLADMVYYGKKYEFAKSIMPCAPDSLIIWYSGQQLTDVNENEDIIWANFVANQLIFETNHMTKTKYMDERPTVFEIGDKCPGRIGAWLGWQIIRSYREKNPDISVHQMMEIQSATAIFNNSGYKPSR